MQPDAQLFPDHRNDRYAVYGVALIALGALTHYGWALAPVEHQAQVWNISGATARLALLAAAVWHLRSRLVLLTSAWWVAEEAMVIGCSAAYIIKPWVIAPGDSQCSSLMAFNIGRVGLLIICLLIWQAVKSNRVPE